MSEFFEINLNDLIEELGEDRAKSILSDFSCPINKDVETFLKHKSIEFAKRGFAATHLIFWKAGDEKELIGYYAISTKSFEISKDAVSNRCAKKLAAFGKYNAHLKSYLISAPLIGQLGKNFIRGNNTLISGDELLKMAIDKIKSIQRESGGRYTYLECEDKPKLIQFYERNGFQKFGNRKLDRDEVDLDGQYLVQLMKYIG